MEGEERNRHNRGGSNRRGGNRRNNNQRGNYRGNNNYGTNNRGGVNNGFTNRGNGNGGNEINRYGGRGGRGRNQYNNRPNGREIPLDNNNNLNAGINQSRSASNDVIPENKNFYKPQKPQYLTINETKSLLLNMLSDTYQNNIPMELNDSNNRFLNILNSIQHHFYTDQLKRYDTVKLILKVVIKANIESQSRHTFIAVLKLIIETKFCTILLDNLINFELFRMQSVDWELVILLLKFFKVYLEILPTFAHERIGARIPNLLVFLNQPSLVIDDLYKDDVLTESEELKVIQDGIVNKTTQETEAKIKKQFYRFELNDDLDPPDNFRELPIFPSAKDLLEVRSKDVFIRRNKSRGTYKDVDDYLDVQFRLMHEDFVQPLREGLIEHLSNSALDKNARHRQFNIRVYYNVSLNNSLPIDRQGIVHTLSFDSSRFKRINWSQTKRFIFASLLVLSDDNFQTLLFATVADRNINNLENGLITVKFFNSKPKKDAQYTMIESTNMFEAYRHVLKRLQNIKAETFCMKDYLVFGQNEIKKPLYMREYMHRVYEMKSCNITPGVDGSRWPRPNDLDLNDSQFEAFKNGLTKEVTIIQGPPGTGKTYLGLKLCNCLLKNVVEKSQNFGPILVVCYTNHALDQFVEGISEFTNRIVRVGSRSKSEKLEPFSLMNIKRANNSITFRRRRGKIHHQIKDLKETILSYQVLLKSSHTRLISLARLSKYLSPVQYEFLQNVELKNWLYGNDYKTTVPIYYKEDLSNIIEWIMYEEYYPQLRDIVLEAFEEVNELPYDPEDMDNEVNFMNNIRRLDVDNDDIDMMTKELEGLMKRVNFENNIEYMGDQNQVDGDGFQMVRSKTSVNLFKSRLKSHQFMTKVEADRIGNNLRNLEISKRWQLYRYWRHLFIEDLMKQSEKIEQEFELKSVELQEVSFEEDRTLMAEKHVIGMTTTGAARYGDVLEYLQCKIIIVEEAAEVLESHIIGSLNRGCQHLILIGDHKQLRPNPSVYRLSKDYNLDLSLFERLINNGIEYRTLDLQHRMRPEISKLMDHIYDNLKDHDSVHAYPNVPGVANNLFFINHSEPESNNNEIMSYSNIYEAQFVVKFCRHLMKNDIPNSKITILTLYTGQMFEIKKLMNKDKNLFKDLRVCVVDNYQGEENDIIILSLVRSNNDGKVGFLKIENRICVCLSRAKHGLYIFGNAEMFTNQNTDSLWTKVIMDLRNRNQLSNGLKVSCQIHPGKQMKLIEKPDDFDLYPEGGCDILCNARLNCGHACKKICHVLDRNHEKISCVEKCAKTCDKCGCRCKKKCYQACSPCNQLVEKVIPNCQHLQLIKCSVQPRSNDCTNNCERELISCGHKCTKLCNEKCEPCLTNIPKECQDCKIINDYPCSVELSEIACKVECQKVFSCGHACKGDCHSCFHGRLHQICEEKCKNILICGHTCKGTCNENCPPCDKSCEYECVHNSCFKKCGDKCIQCFERCQWKCAHKSCTSLCSEKCDRDVCDEKCNKTKLICNTCKKIFPCYGVCGEYCRKICKACDKSDMFDIFFGTEDDEGARFITLWTCGHSFEVTSMDTYMNTDQFNKQIITKTCPRCKTVINQKSCFRYGNIIKKLQFDVQQIQTKLLDSLNIKITHEFSPKFEVKMVVVHEFFKAFQLDNYFETLHQEYDRYKRDISSFVDKKRTISLNLVLEVESRVLRRYKRLNPTIHKGIVYIKRCITKFISWLHPDKRYFKQEELDQFYDELARIELMLYIYDCCKEIPRNLSVELNDRLIKLMDEIKFNMKNNKESRQEMKIRIKKCYQSFGYLPLLDITNEERRQIVAAVGLGKGRWFKCPRGHYYVIGECGGATQIARCPECNEEIGGQNHTLLRNNRFAPEMDEAERTAWPTMMQQW